MRQYKLKDENQGEEYRLHTGDRLVLRDNAIGGFEVVYAGKPDNVRFSLIAQEREAFSKRMNGNLFFRDDDKSITLDDREFGVLDVNDHSLLLKYLH